MRGIREVCPAILSPTSLWTRSHSAACGFTPGDILVVKHKIVSKAEGRTVALDSVKPSAAAQQLRRKNGADARVVELAMREAERVLRNKHVLITETRHGFVCANSGVDVSNVDGGKTAVLLPVDPDRSAAQIHRKLKKLTGLHIPVIIADSFGRAWREGLCDVAIGVAGMKVDPRLSRQARCLRLQAARHRRGGGRRTGLRGGAGVRQRFARSGLYNPGVRLPARRGQRAAAGASGRERFVSVSWYLQNTSALQA